MHVWKECSELLLLQPQTFSFFFLGSIWSDFTPQIQGLDKDKFTVVVWDPPGYGHSRPPERDFSPGYFQRDADLAFKLMKVDLQYDLQDYKIF